ncbi:exodeoxyribonuclease VII small subunit [Ferrovibrio sp.]|jgi:exodeoxyribonuclease VII small subunit|uniref:exodeoxyribonuclease VII small subunit n=1 Tax=Ferrovibrio sp. TaxID=1917215 RepID=UPI0035B4A742
MSKAKDAAENAPEAIPADIAALSFEAALKALDEIVTRLESGRVDLEESIALYGRGALLKRHCEAKLKAAEEKIEKIVVGADGQPGAQPFKAD